MKSILALDLGTSTGFAVNYGTPNPTIGTWRLATPAEIRMWGKTRQTRTKDPRVERLCEKLSVLTPVDLILFEDVEFSKYRKQTQLWAALRSAVWLCGKAPVIETVPVKTLKKFAIHGSADKDMMAAALKTQYPKLYHRDLDDNAVDAAWLWVWGMKHLCRN